MEKVCWKWFAVGVAIGIVIGLALCALGSGGFPGGPKNPEPLGYVKLDAAANCAVSGGINGTGLDQWDVTLTCPNGTLTTKTNAQGLYSFSFPSGATIGGACTITVAVESGYSGVCDTDSATPVGTANVIVSTVSPRADFAFKQP